MPVKFVHGDFHADIFRLIFFVEGEQIRVNLRKNQITIPLQSMYEVKKQLTKEQFQSLMNQIYDYIFDLN
jgi:hypothetical protein